TFLSINLSPAAILAGRYARLVDCASTGRLVIEITEHAQVENYPALRDALRPLRARGARVAVDNTEAGYASLAHVLRLSPEIIKLDREVTHGIDRDRRRRALARALVSFAHDSAAKVIAEGIQTGGQFQ